MTYLAINGIDFADMAAITSYEENLTVKEGPNAGESADTGRVIRDVLGGFLGHTITLRAKSAKQEDVEAFDYLWECLKNMSVTDSVAVDVVDNQEGISYDAYFTAAKRTLSKVTQDGINIWDSITLTLTPIAPQIARG